MRTKSTRFGKKYWNMWKRIPRSPWRKI